MHQGEVVIWLLTFGGGWYGIELPAAPMRDVPQTDRLQFFSPRGCSLTGLGDPPH